jgi:hypothetical protein
MPLRREPLLRRLGKSQPCRQNGSLAARGLPPQLGLPGKGFLLAAVD